MLIEEFVLRRHSCVKPRFLMHVILVICSSLSGAAMQVGGRINPFSMMEYLQLSYEEVSGSNLKNHALCVMMDYIRNPIDYYCGLFPAQAALHHCLSGLS